MTDAGAKPFDLLAWDTAFWGFRVAQVRGATLSPNQVRDLDLACRHDGIACLYFLADLDDPITTNTAEDAGFRFADVRMTYQWRRGPLPLARPARDDPSLVVRPSRPSDIAPLRQIAAASHRETRFFYDRRFPRAGCRELYATWIARSCDGYADTVLVAALDEDPVGYVTAHLPQAAGEAGRIGLVGVGEQARGRGIGSLLATEALRWFVAAGIPEVTVVTQGRNDRAQRLYQRCGFESLRTQLWFHKWYLGG